MKKLPINQKHIVSILMYVTCLASCSLNASHTPVKSIPISWYPGFTMQELLSSPGSPINQPSDLPRLINAPWYAEIHVTATKTGEALFSSCKDYIEKASKATRTIKDNEMSAYLEFATMCDATQLLVTSKKSEETFLPNDFLNTDTPKIWPKEIAFQISTEESRRNALNPRRTTWADVTPVLKYEKKSDTLSVYFLNGGYQEINIIGKGDFNRDGIEDILVLSKDYVEGGNYFNMRLFVLSVNADGHWQLINAI